MGLTVLIADDETMPRTVLRDHLPWEELGVTRIVEASDGDETVEQARACRPDILISDVKMPRKTGLEAAEAIRTFCPQRILGQGVPEGRHPSESRQLRGKAH